MDIKPVENYQAPNLPTLGEIHNNPASLKKLPKRWKKKVALLAGIGL